nr:ethanolamine utilization protein EutH [Bacillus massiliigorillae]
MPVALAMFQKRDHKNLALGMMSGVLTVPISVFITTSMLALMETKIRDTISTTAEPTYQLSMSIGTILINLVTINMFYRLLVNSYIYKKKTMSMSFSLFSSL